jgi:hypothetical protein
MVSTTFWSVIELVVPACLPLLLVVVVLLLLLLLLPLPCYRCWHSLSPSELSNVWVMQYTHMTTRHSPATMLPQLQQLVLPLPLPKELSSGQQQRWLSHAPCLCSLDWQVRFKFVLVLQYSQCAAVAAGHLFVTNRSHQPDACLS